MPRNANRHSSAAKRRKRKLKIALAAVLSAFAAVFAAAFAVSYCGIVYPGVYVENLSVSGMSRGRLEAALADYGWPEKAGKTLTVKSIGGAAVEVSQADAGLILSTGGVAEAALEHGRSGNIFANLISFFKSIGGHTDVSLLTPGLDRAYISRTAETLCSAVSSGTGGPEYFIDEENLLLKLTKGSGGAALDRAVLEERIISALEAGDNDIEFCSLASEPETPDFSGILSQICTDAEPACFSADGSHTVIPGRAGYLFDTAEAERLWRAAAPGENISVPLERDSSVYTAEYLDAMMYRDLLGAVTTKYNNSDEDRSSNVRLAASIIDGTVLFPGEVFSFNDTVGARTAEAGFLMAPAYAGYDDITEEIGGGVCQVSTGVYAASLFAFLQIKTHTCHIYPTNYIQLGTDATVTIPQDGGRTIDLQIVNNRAWPVKITAYCEETEDRGDGKPLKTVTVEIWGTLEPDDYMPVEFDNSYENIYSYDRVIDPAYPDREGYKLKFTHDEQEFEDDYGKGIRTLTYIRIIDSAGNVVEKRIVNPLYSFGYGMDTYYYKK